MIREAVSSNSTRPKPSTRAARLLRGDTTMLLTSRRGSGMLVLHRGNTQDSTNVDSTLLTVQHVELYLAAEKDTGLLLQSTCISIITRRWSLQSSQLGWPSQDFPKLAHRMRNSQDVDSCLQTSLKHQDNSTRTQKQALKSTRRAPTSFNIPSSSSSASPLSRLFGDLINHQHAPADKPGM